MPQMYVDRGIAEKAWLNKLLDADKDIQGWIESFVSCTFSKFLSSTSISARCFLKFLSTYGVTFNGDIYQRSWSISVRQNEKKGEA